MSDVIKIMLVAVVVSILSAVLKKDASEYVIIVQICGILVIAVMVIGDLIDARESFDQLMKMSVLDGEYINILLKVTVISIVCKIGADTCRDNSNSSLASAVEVCAKIIIFVLIFPMIRAVATLALSMT